MAAVRKRAKTPVKGRVLLLAVLGVGAALGAPALAAVHPARAPFGIAPAGPWAAPPGGRPLAWRAAPMQLQARMTPDQRAQFQQQMTEMRNRRAEREGNDAPGGAAHPKLSPEERRQLREQIRDAHRDWNGTRRGPQGNR